MSQWECGRLAPPHSEGPRARVLTFGPILPSEAAPVPRFIGMSRSLAIGLLALGLASASRATTLRHLDTRELTLESDDIVVGEVASLRSYWDAAHRRILT